MTYAEYVAAEVDEPVVIEAYVQANQSWWDGKLTVYTQDKDGAYFLYNLLVNRINKVVMLLEVRSMEFMDLLHEPA